MKNSSSLTTSLRALPLLAAVGLLLVARLILIGIMLAAWRLHGWAVKAQEHPGRLIAWGLGQIEPAGAARPVAEPGKEPAWKNEAVVCAAVTPEVPEIIKQAGYLASQPTQAGRRGWKLPPERQRWLLN